MASTGLKGSYRLTDSAVDSNVTQTSAGAYALGRLEDEKFLVSYIGRSDDNVNARLKQHVGDYDRFKYGYFSSPKTAFEKECNLYHDFDPPDNKIHPARPNNSNWTCPRCSKFD